MKITTTSVRLKKLMAERNLRQVDILNLAKPYCAQLGVKLEKNDLSQYVNGKVEPGQEKLTVLGLALDVSETWLMGYDVPISRESMNQDTPLSTPDILDEIDVAFYGDYKELNETDKETLRAMARLFRERQGKQE